MCFEGCVPKMARNIDDSGESTEKPDKMAVPLLSLGTDDL
jgi:hypothetical protein